MNTKKQKDGRAHGHGTTDVPYLLRRLSQDAPAILSRYEQGEFPSVRAACKAASIVQDEPPDGGRGRSRTGIAAVKGPRALAVVLPFHHDVD